MPVGVPLLLSMHLFLDGLAHELEPETLGKYRRDAATVAGWFPGETLLTLTRSKVRDRIAGLALSKKRVLNLLTPLRGAIAQATDDEVLPNNPLENFKIRRVRKVTKEKPRPFSHAEVAALARTDLGALWEAWAWSGLRPGEIIGLEPGDVDIARGRLHVRRAVRSGREKAPKTAAGARAVTLLPPAIDAYTRALAGHPGKGKLFTNPNTGGWWRDDKPLALAFRAACAAAGVDYRPPKHLRHTFASWALSSGESPMWVAGQMGHEDATMVLRVYADWIPDADPHAGRRMVAAKAV